MTPKDWTNFVRIIYTGPSSDERHRVHLQQGDPKIDKVEYEQGYTRVDFDLDDRTEMGSRIQKYRVETVERLLKEVFEAGVNEGKRQVRDTLKEVIGL